jgi:CBS domain-containing protein
MNGKIKDLMTKDVATLHANDSLVDAAQRMRQRDVGSMPVVEDGDTVVGALTDRDISVMTRDVVCCYEDQEIIEAIELMDRYKVRRMPVVDRERHLRGLFTIGKVARTEEHEDPATRLFRSVTEPPVK